MNQGERNSDYCIVEQEDERERLNGIEPDKELELGQKMIFSQSSRKKNNALSIF